MTKQQKSLRRSLADRVAAFASLILPTRTHSAPWSFATALVLAFATVGFLLVDSDDMTLAGIYRQAHLKVAELYSTGTEIYAQKDDVAARLQRVGSDIGEIWETLGGEDEPASFDHKQDTKKKKHRKNKSAGPTEKS
jgi:hypothetical protein